MNVSSHEELLDTCLDKNSLEKNNFLFFYLVFLENVIRKILL